MIELGRSSRRSETPRVSSRVPEFAIIMRRVRANAGMLLILYNISTAVTAAPGYTVGARGPPLTNEYNDRASHHLGPQGVIFAAESRRVAPPRARRSRRRRTVGASSRVVPAAPPQTWSWRHWAAGYVRAAGARLERAATVALAAAGVVARRRRRGADVAEPPPWMKYGGAHLEQCGGESPMGRGALGASVDASGQHRTQPVR